MSRVLYLAQALVQWACTANAAEVERGLKALGVPRPRLAGSAH